jgi:uncharacterized protein YcaQ
MVTSVSVAEARRIALAASGFGGKAAPTRHGPSVGTRQITATIERLGLIQLDSVNVFERSHYLPFFARLGGFDKELLDRHIFAPPGSYTEYWAHEAAIIPMSSWPLWRWKMAALRESDPDRYPWVRDNTALLDWLRLELGRIGPVSAGEIDHDPALTSRQGPWWGWSEVKMGLEFLFRWGEVVSAGRTRFERRYALAEQVIPEAIRSIAIPRADAHRQLIAHAAGALGIGTIADLADYYRLKTPEVHSSVNDLVDEGVLLPVSVDGWTKPAVLHRDARAPRTLEVAAFLSPFDPVVWNRSRAERLFDFHYRIEIYTPAAKRVFGYYSLPILIDDELVGRIDLKNDRQARVLRVQAAWYEARFEAGSEAGFEAGSNARHTASGAAPTLSEIAERVVEVLKKARDWQNLERIEIVDRGNLAPQLSAVLASTRA